MDVFISFVIWVNGIFMGLAAALLVSAARDRKKAAKREEEDERTRREREEEARQVARFNRQLSNFYGYGGSAKGQVELNED